jgi:hypothetical protein
MLPRTRFVAPSVELGWFVNNASNALPNLLPFLSTLKRRGYPTYHCSESEHRYSHSRLKATVTSTYEVRSGTIVPFVLHRGRFEIGLPNQLGFCSLDLIVTVFSKTRHLDSGWQSHLCFQPAVTEETYASLDLTHKTIKGCLKVPTVKPQGPSATRTTIQPTPTTNNIVVVTTENKNY